MQNNMKKPTPLVAWREKEDLIDIVFDEGAAHLIDDRYELGDLWEVTDCYSKPCLFFESEPFKYHVFEDDTDCYHMGYVMKSVEVEIVNGEKTNNIKESLYLIRSRTAAECLPVWEKSGQYEKWHVNSLKWVLLD